MTIERPMFPPRRDIIETFEPIAVQDTFVTALARVERVGPCRRLVLAVTEQGSDGACLHVVVGKVIVPAEALAEIAAQLLQHAPCEAPLREIERLTEAKRRALSIADERAKEACSLSAALNAAELEILQLREQLAAQLLQHAHAGTATDLLATAARDGATAH